MKVCYHMLIAASLVAGIREQPVGFLETKTSEEYTPNLEQYLENQYDFISVVLPNIYDWESMQNYMFNQIYDCPISDDIQQILDDLSIYCAEEDPGLSALDAIMSYIISYAENCQDNESNSDKIKNKYSNWYSAYSPNESVEMLKTKAGDNGSGSSGRRASIIVGEINIIEECEEESMPEKAAEELTPEESAEELMPEEAEGESAPEEAEEELTPEEAVEESTPEEAEEESTPEEAVEESTPEEDVEESTPEEDVVEEEKFTRTFDEIVVDLQTAIDPLCPPIHFNLIL